MSTARRRSQPEVKETAGDAKGLEKIELSETPLQESYFDAQRNLLRQKWELASVLNFLHVFEEILGNELKISGEEVEMGLIKPDNLIARLHIVLLKGIPPVSKNLSGTDAWITALCKKLATWWPWVAEGEIPLSAAKGEEVSRYKELDPATRLLILKALCELRANQDDIASFINNALKNGTQLSFFRKEQIAGDGRGTTYWYDGNSDVGLRLYKEVKQAESKPRRKGKGNLNLPAFSLQWETLATNLEEFREVMGKYSSSKVPSEAYVAEQVESEAIPVLEKIEKKKERALKKKERQEKQILLDGFRDTYAAGFTRSCRTRRPVNYTFDDYDQAINEALQVAKRRKTSEEPRQKETQNHRGKVEDTAVNGVSDSGSHSEDDSIKEHDSVVYDSDNDSFQDDGNDDGKDGDSDYDEEKDDPETGEEFLDDDNGFEKKSKAKVHSQKNKDKASMPYRHFGSRWSSRLAGRSSHPAGENKNPVSRTRLRQRPTRNTTARSNVIPHSEDEETSENTVTDASSDEDHLSDADDGNRSSEDDPASDDDPASVDDPASDDDLASDDDPDKPSSDANDENHSSDADPDNHSSDADPDKHSSDADDPEKRSSDAGSDDEVDH